MEFAAVVERIRAGQPAGFPANGDDIAFARQLDAQSPLQNLRDEYIYPTKSSIKKKALDGKLPGKFLDLITALTDHPRGRRWPRQGRRCSRNLL